MREKIIAGNWKMNCTPQEAAQLASALVRELAEENRVTLIIAPPFVALPTVENIIRTSAIKLAAQNAFPEKFGAFTGEVSAPMLKEIGVEYVIVGHSERRQIFGETDEFINSKVLQLIQQGLKVILCIGETLEQREANQALKVCHQQLRIGLQNLEESLCQESLVIAYEPVWAIGTGRSASSDDAQQIHRGCRDYLATLYNENLASKLPILYGGSVKPENINSLMSMQDIDGALVGGASLKAESFIQLVRYKEEE